MAEYVSIEYKSHLILTIFQVTIADFRIYIRMHRMDIPQQEILAVFSVQVFAEEVIFCIFEKLL